MRKRTEKIRKKQKKNWKNEETGRKNEETGSRNEETGRKNIPSDYVDIALIRKCKTIDLPALQSASKTCKKSLLKYLSFPGVNNSYSDQISSL